MKLLDRIFLDLFRLIFHSTSLRFTDHLTVYLQRDSGI